ncbi:MAG: DNA primase [Alphaproteobacteria bacterium]
MRFSPEFLDELRARAPLADVVSRRVRLKKRGRDYLGLCPFHKEKTASFTVNEEKGFYHCFGCGAHGDAIDFVMRSEGLQFPEAVEKLALQAGLSLPVETQGERERADAAQGLLGALETAARWFERELRGPGGRHAREYLAARGLDEATIRRFRLGFAPDQRTALKSALQEKEAAAGASPSGAPRFPESVLVEAGLLIRPEEGGPTYDRFRGRVIFPITDRRGRVIAFGGRALGDVKPKYLNSPDTPVFHKGRVLYNFAAARKSGFEAGTLVVAEGYMDVIAFARAGIDYAVAPLGTALTEDQIGELWRVAREPVLCFDGDEAGLRAARAAAERALPLLKPGLSLRFAWVPAGEDPDSLLAGKGPEALRQVIANPEPLCQVLWQAELEANTADTPERRAHLEVILEALARRVGDIKVRDEYLRFFQDRFRAMFAPPAPGQGARAPGSYRPRPYLPGAMRRTAVDGETLLPKILLATVINHPDLLEEVAEELGTVDFSTPDLDKVRQAVLELAAEPGLDREQLQSHLNDRGYSAALRSVLNQGVYMHAGFASPETEPSEARKGWRHAFGRYCLPRVWAQIKEAQKAYAETGTPENSERLVSLQRHLHELQATISAIDEASTGAERPGQPPGVVH